MYICYIDESGDSGTLQITDKNSNPFFIVVGIIVEHSRLIPLTHDFLRLKRTFFPNHFNATPLPLDGILVEIKGNDLRKNLRGSNRRRWQQTIGYIDSCIKLLNQHSVRLIAKALIKNPGSQNNDAAFYGNSIMHICKHFNIFLEFNQEFGLVIADSRKTPQNQRTTHTIFTQRHQSRGNSYPRILEMPSYGHSNNFAMIQLADLVCSAVVFPMLSDAFGSHLHGNGNVHISTKYTSVRNRYKTDIKNMQFMYQDANNFWCGGLLVSDKTPANRKTNAVFK